MKLAEKLGLGRLHSAVKYLLVKDLNVQSKLSVGPDGNRALRDAFLSLFNILKPTTFCDIGANDGSSSLAVRHVAPDCAIYAFEANPRTYELNASLLKERGITYLNLAVNDSNGSTTMFAPRSLSQCYVDGEIVPTSIVEPETTAKTSLLMRNEEATYQEFAVEARTLDGFLRSKMPAGSGSTFFLWIDVEGAAAKVLAGAEETLKHTLAIFIETENFAFWKEQEDAGGIVHRLINKGFVPIARDREYGDKQFNILFVHSSVTGKISRALFDAGSHIRTCVTPAPQITTKSKEARLDGTAPGFTSVGACLQTQIPVFVPCFNNPTYLRNMIEQLRALRFANVIVVDNASTFPPMLEYLSTLAGNATVIPLRENRGPRSIFLDEKNYSLLPQHFCVTDPDLEFNKELPDDFLAEMVCLTERHAIGKAGFSLDISDQTQLRQDSFVVVGKEYKIWEWEGKFWPEPLELVDGRDQVYRTQLDTTFAVYNKRYFNRDSHLDALRLAGRYTCRHLPWYRDKALPEAEEEFYRQTARYSHYQKQSPKLSAESALSVLLYVYQSRADLQEAFPEAKNGQYSGLIDWAVGVCTRQWEDGAFDTLHRYSQWYSAQNA